MVVHALGFYQSFQCLSVIMHVGSKSQKVPVQKMVRTDSTDPAGRLHAYLQMKPPGLPESSLNTVRYELLLDLSMELSISKCCIETAFYATFCKAD